MNSAEQVARALELCAERDIDPVPAIYDKFFAACDQAVEVMGHSDGPMRGRMAAQTFELLVDDNLIGEDSYLRWEIENHIGAYGVHADIYPAYFAAVKEAFREALEDCWSDVDEQAWNARIALLQEDLDAHVAAQAAN